jgi:hypothetical protein
MATTTRAELDQSNNTFINGGGVVTKARLSIHHNNIGDYIDSKVASTAGGQLNATPTDSPTPGVYVYNISEPGTYTNFSGVVVSSTDFEDGFVQIRYNPDTDTWFKFIQENNGYSKSASDAKFSFKSAQKRNFFLDPTFQAGSEAAMGTLTYTSRGFTNIVKDSPVELGDVNSIQFDVNNTVRNISFYAARTNAEITALGIAPGDTLTFGAWIKTDAAIPLGDISLYYNYAGAIFSGRVFATSFLVEQWTFIQFNSTVPATPIEMRLVLNLRTSSGTAAFRITGLTLVKGTDAHDVVSKYYPTSLNGAIIDRRTVGYEAVDFLTNNKNLFDYRRITPNFYLSTDGTVVPTPPTPIYCYSDYIPVVPGETYYRNFYHNTVFYDKEKRYRGAIQTSESTNILIPPAGVWFVRVNVTTAALPTFQFEKGNSATSFVQNKKTLDPSIEAVPDGSITNTKLDPSLQAAIASAGTPDDITLQKIGGVLGVKKITYNLLEAVTDASKIKLTNLSQEVIDAITGTGEIIIDGGHIYNAGRWLNSNGANNSISDAQSMIDTVAAAGGGVIYFQSGHYLFDTDIAGQIQLKNNVHIVGENTTNVLIEMRSDAEGTHLFRSVGVVSNCSISNVTLKKTGKGTLIPPAGANRGKRTHLKIETASEINLHNVLFTDSGFNIGYDPSANGGQGNAVGAGDTLNSIDVSGSAKLKANNCDIISSGWGIFLISSSGGRVEWNGNIKTFYKSTGIHGTNAELVINGNVTSTCSAGTGCISCSGGRTIINGNLFRQVENPTTIAPLACAVFIGSDDFSDVTLNGNIFTNAGALCGSYGRFEMTGNTYHDSTIASARLFWSSSFAGGFLTAYVTGNIVSKKLNVASKLFYVQGNSKLYFNGIAEGLAISYMGNEAVAGSPELTINGIIKNADTDNFFMYSGTLRLNGIMAGADNIIRVFKKAAKSIRIGSTEIINSEPTYNEAGGTITTPTATSLLFVADDADKTATISETDVEVFTSHYKGVVGQPLIKIPASETMTIKAGGVWGNVALGTGVTNSVSSGYTQY